MIVSDLIEKLEKVNPFMEVYLNDSPMSSKDIMFAFIDPNVQESNVSLKMQGRYTKEILHLSSF